MRRRWEKTLLSSLLAAALLSGCSGPKESEELKSATYVGTATGFGGDVTVSIEVQDGKILSAKVTGDKETADIGGKYLSQFQAQIVDDQGKVDAVAGATVTSNAVKTALQQAMVAAGLAEEASYTMAAGTYEGKAHGFSCIDYVNVKVTVSDTQIEAIELLDTFVENMDSYENRYMCEGAFEILAPQIKEYQSIGVDGITGATGSSNGIKGAVRNALEQAFQANGLSQEEATTAVNATFTANKPEKNTDVVRMDTDVVVVGAGGAGTIASLTAIDQGVQVINIEKTFRWGGQSMFTGGPKAYNANTTEAEAQAILDAYEKSIRISRFGDDTKWNDPAYQAAHSDEYTPVNAEAYKAVVPASGKAVRTLVENGMCLYTLEFSPDPEVVDQMMANINEDSGLTPEDIDAFPSAGMGSTVNYYMGEKYFEIAYNTFLKKGGKSLLNTTAKELIYADDSKREIVGVRAYGDDGTTYEVYAKAIIMATGGYGGNDELMDQWAVGGDNWIYYGWQGNDGDGILMALDAGANPYNLEAYPMSHQRMGFQFITTFDKQTTEDGRQWSPNDLTVVLACNPDGVYVTENGEPFDVATMGSMNGFAGSMGTYYIGSSYYVVYSEDQLESYRKTGMADTTMGFMNVGSGIPKDYPLGDWVDTVLAEAESQGWAWKVSSLEEGDDLLKLKTGTLAAAYAANGNGLNHTEDDGYVIIRCCGLAISSCGGVEVNGKMQAVRPDGSAIENLFITGNDGFGNIMATGAEYPIGGDAGMFVFGSGSTAGEQAAALVKAAK